MAFTAMGRALLMLAVAALVIGADGYTASQPGNTMLAQRGGRGQGSTGIRALVKGRAIAVDSTLGRITLAIGGAVVEAGFRPAVLADVKPGDDRRTDRHTGRGGHGGGDGRGPCERGGHNQHVWRAMD